MEILQEQVKPTFTVCIAQRIDAVFNVLGMICIFVVGILGHHLPILSHMLVAIKVCQ